MIMEIIAGVAVLIALVVQAFLLIQVNKRNRELIKAIMARSLKELDESDVIEHGLKTKERGNLEEEKLPDYVAVGDATDEDWDMVEKTLQESQKLDTENV